MPATSLPRAPESQSLGGGLGLLDPEEQSAAHDGGHHRCDRHQEGGVAVVVSVIQGRCKLDAEDDAEVIDTVLEQAGGLVSLSFLRVSLELG